MKEHYEDAIADCTKALEFNPDYLKALLRRAELYEKTDKLDEALEDYTKALERDCSLQVARAACMVRYHSSASPMSVAYRSTECASKKQSPRKKIEYQQKEHGFEPKFQNLYLSIHTIFTANFIETTDMVQQIQQFKFYGSLFSSEPAVAH